MKFTVQALSTATALLLLLACGSSDDSGANHGPGGPGMGFGGMNHGASAGAAVPVEVAPVTRSTIADSLYANGTLEAEREVDLIARTAGPITELLAEEGDRVTAGQLLARIDPREAENQVAIAQVAFDEARLAWNRSQTMHSDGLVSAEAHDAALAAYESASAQLDSARLQLDYTEIRAPFDALVTTRYIKLAQHVSSGSQLFRISDFNPLLCAIEVPEKDLSRLALGQPARIQVEAYAEREFSGSVLRIRPTVNATTGTITVTLEVRGEGVLRPGMFASVHLRTDLHHDAIVIPRDALVLDAIGDTVFVKEGPVARRRNVKLGFREGDTVEVLEGLAEGEELVVLGQDGLADGTEVSVLSDGATAPATMQAEGPPAGGPSPEQLEQIKARMRSQGLSQEQIQERLAHMGQGPPDGQGASGGPGVPPPPGADGGLPPRLVERIKNASPEELERIKERMKSFGMDEAKIDETVAQIRGGEPR